MIPNIVTIGLSPPPKKEKKINKNIKPLRGWWKAIQSACVAVPAAPAWTQVLVLL